MEKTIFLLLIMFGMALTCHSQPQEVYELKSVFDKFNVEGSILIYDQNENLYFGYNLEKCNVPFSPASTFKIPNTLIALECGIATPDHVFKWNGDKRNFPSWEKDMTLAEAFKLSAVPVYQEIARKIGVERMQYYTRLFNYGEMDITEENIDKFWLEGNSVITQYQQIYFLQKLYNLQLPVSEKAIRQTKEIMLFEETENYKISGKTGWAIRQKEGVTWFVGFIETKDNVYFFATNIAPNSNTDLNTFTQVRIDITKEIFKKLGIIEN